LLNAVYSVIFNYRKREIAMSDNHAFNYIKEMLHAYVDQATNKADALHDISHISFVLHHEYEKEAEVEAANNQFLAEWYC
jgi:hypothetical protein